MLRTVHLHGEMARLFAPSYKFDVDTPQQAGRALACCVPGFAEYIVDKRVRVVRGDPEDGVDFDESTLGFKLGLCPDLHIVPVAAGADSDAMGVAKVVLGVALIALSFVIPPAAFGAGTATMTLFGSEAISVMLLAGAAMTLGGVSALLAPSPSFDDKLKDKPEERASFIFNGPVNRVEEGGIVPIGYGRMRVGSVLGSASLQVEKLL